MKYAYATVIVLCLLASTSWSASAVLIRNCTLAGGELTVAEISTTQNLEEWAFCKFNKSYVGAIDVMILNTEKKFQAAFTNYSAGIYECSGQLLTARVLNTQKEFLICLYEDGSMIDLNTLFLGLYSLENFQLNKYLGL